MKRFKKLIAGVLTVAISATCTIPFTGSAAVTNVLLGDANGDGVVNMADSTTITQYLYGAFAAPQYCFTAMDINQDCIVDETDVYIIQYRVACKLPNETANKELYTLPDNSKRYYYKYDCSSKKRSTYVLQSLPEFIMPDSQIESLQYIAPEERDYENTNVVQLEMSGNIGSGFIVGENVIATAAHCVYGSNGFASDVTVNVYKQDGTTVAQTFKANSYHIPKNYTEYSDGKQDNYDYALIYVDDIVENGVTKNLTSYAKPFEIGVAAKEFMTTERDITASGFSQRNPYARYYSTGEVIDFSGNEDENHNKPNLRMQIAAETIGGKSGGVMYYTSTYNKVTHKSAVAVLTGGSETVGTWGVRMNPTLLNFYFQNSNIY